jgi:sulfur carrier protein
MQIHINDQEFSLSEGASVADALSVFGATPPFAVALNDDFVARGRYPQCHLKPGDRLDVVRPIAGG